MQILRHPRTIAIAMVLFWAALIFACVMAFLPKPPTTPVDRFGDKFEHVLAFSALAGLAMIAFGREAQGRIIERLCFLGAAIEVVQSIPALHRDCDARDWVADTIAVVVVTVVMRLVVPPRESRAP